MHFYADQSNTNGWQGELLVHSMHNNIYAINRKKLERKRKLEGTRTRGMEQGQRKGGMEALSILNN